MRWLAPLPIQDIVLRPTPPAVSSSSTKPAAPAASPRASSPPWSTKDSPARLPASPARTAPVPLGDAALEVLLSDDTIEAAAIKLTQVSR